MIQRLTILLAIISCNTFILSPQAFARASTCEDALSQGYVVVVAGYSSGSDIVGALNDRGVKSVIHIQPTPTEDIAPLLLSSFNASHYRENIIYNGDFNALMKQLAGKPIAAIIAGTETGVGLADQLTDFFGLRGNGTQFSEAKRNKFLMHQVLKKANIPSMRDLLTNSLPEILAWVQSPQGNNNHWPVVIKPVDSAATEGVHICADINEVTNAFRALLGTRTLLGTTIHQVLAQEYLDGTEYVVNIESKNGKDIVGEIWKYHKRDIDRPGGGKSKIYLYDELLAFDGPEADALISYAKRVLAALNIVNGPSHMEIMMTARGPVLVEVGARHMGGHTHIATRKAVGVSPLDLTLMTMLWPEEFDALYSAGPLQRHMHVRKIQLVSKVTGRLKAVNHIERIRKLPTFWDPDHHSASFPKAGDDIKFTVDLLTSPGCLWLVGTEADVKRDYDIYLGLEETMFEVERGQPGP